MRITVNGSSRGIALIIVLISVFVLAMLAAGFAYSMRVETKLARNASYDTELEWMGRSGVEYARWVLGQPKREPYDSLNQVWAGGPGGWGDTNGPLAGIRLSDPVKCGSGEFTVKIVDCDRKININVANDVILQQALSVMGVEAADAPAIANSVLDWIDRDDQTRVGGAESDFYQGLTPPYVAKNGPIDNISELLLIKGITPELFWGLACTNHTPAWFQVKGSPFGPGGVGASPVGLVDLFTPVSTGRININTASAQVLQVILMDPEAATQIVRLRSGFDGIEGTEDDTPIGSQGLSIPDALVSAGLNNQAAQQIARFFDVRSGTFEVQVDAEISGYRRHFVAILGRANARDTQILSFSSQ